MAAAAWRKQSPGPIDLTTCRRCRAMALGNEGARR
jgi:hypothetical protein